MPQMKWHCKRSLQTLFSKEVEGLQDDSFEGSTDEHRIFTEVFFGNDAGRSSKRCVVTGVIDFESDYSKHTDVSRCSNSENSAMTSQGDSCNVKEDSRRNSRPACLSEEFALPSRNDDDVNVKRLKLSVDKLSNEKQFLGKVSHSSVPLKGGASGISQPALHSVCHTVTCRLVESSSQGVTSSCYLLKRHVEMDRGGDIGDRDVSNCRLSSLDGSDRKQVVASKAIASPISQESSATKLLVAGPSVTVPNKSGSLRYGKPRWKESSFVELSAAEKSLTADSMKDPRSLLRYHINCLLRAAGWVIGRRKRANKNNGIGEFVYKSPEGRPIREFRRAWKLCGESLFADAKNVVQETDGKRWTELTHFWSDLSKTLTEIEEQLDNLKSTSGLAHWWCLLDPFAGVVFIDKTIATLKAGKSVKAKRSLVVDSCTKLDAILALQNVDDIGNQFAERHIAVQPCGSSLVSDSALTIRTSDQIGCLFEVPISSGNANIYLGGSETASPHQDSNTSSPSCDKDRLEREELPLRVIKDVSIDFSEEKGKLFEGKITDRVGNLVLGSVDNHSNCTNDDLQEFHNSGRTYVQLNTRIGASQCCRPSSAEDIHLVDMDDAEVMQHSGHIKKEGGQCIEAPRFRMDDASFSADIVLKRKGHKKSKKISEIKLTTLYQNDEIGLSTYKAGLHGIDENNIQLESRGFQECFVANVGSDKSFKKSSFCSSQHRNQKKLKIKKFSHNSDSSKKLVKINYDSKHPKELNFENGTDEAFLHVNSECLDSRTWRHATQVENAQKKSMTCRLKDDDLLISAIIKNKSFRSTIKRSGAKRISCKSKALRKRKSQNGTCRLLPRSFNKGGKHFMEGKWSAFNLRTVFCWLINSGIVSLNELIQYRNPKDDAVIKDGLVTRDGILCRCCDEVFSVSKFKSHAGFKLNRPCLNLFMESGKPFTLCQLEAWSAEYKSRKSATRTVDIDEMDQNDDSCGLCGDGGELICCDNCPSTFHQACLYTQDLPEGNWYCPHCTCRICGDVVDDKEASKSPGALKCAQCEHKYHEACLKEKGIEGGVASDTWFCGQNCQEVYSGLHSRIGVMNLISDGFSWTLMRCIHGDHKVHSAQRFVALKAECNSKLAVALTIMEECFLPMVDPRTGIDMIPHVLYNWGSQFARLNYYGFYTAVLEKDDVLLSVASIRIHGVTVAEMPLIATCSKYRRQGMCRRLINSIEEMLKSFKVKKLVISAIPNLVETWTVGFGFEPLEDCERRSLSNINLMVFPGTIWLKKSLCGNQVADQQTGKTVSCHASPSGADVPTEIEACSEGGPIIEPVLQPDRNLCVKDETEMTIPECKNLQVGEEQEGSLDKQSSKREEPSSALEESQLEIVCHVGTLALYDERQLPLNESQKTNVLRGNEKY